ncbi:hypothetical protein CYMTET_42658 [Cymbomonas tetramitiformis]|uniref:Uncharacterized protein n=1 Tax=Cymbomonas tetramitiformis TaxID=36881 RepID=A0AAE0C5V7_9CHLO|nr:hypothetical protein CYMTET_42658 [Cymbomonas tetramitiformis]
MKISYRDIFNSIAGDETMKCVDARVYVSPVGAVVGIFLLVATGTTPFPQSIKLSRARCVVAALSTCSQLSLGLAQGFSYAASCIAFVAFAPQLVSTWRLKSPGSLSFIFFTLQAVGNLMVAANFIFIQRDPWTAWAPVLVSSIMQFAIIALAAYYSFHQHSSQSKGDKQLEEAKEPMLVPSEQENLQ